MLKKWIYYSGITLATAFITSGFRASAKEDGAWFDFSQDRYYNNTSGDFDYTSESLLYTGKTFTGFKENIAYKESQGQYDLVNRFGFMGKYQFGASALRSIGISNTDRFLKSPKLQEKAFSALLAKNKWELRQEISAFEGKVIGGVRITESGILAAAHLVGAGSVKKYFRSKGRVSVRDGFGTSMKTYLRRYAGFDTSHIVAQDSPQVASR
jgi:hypothetical protein